MRSQRDHSIDSSNSSWPTTGNSVVLLPPGVPRYARLEIPQMSSLNISGSTKNELALTAENFDQKLLDLYQERGFHNEPKTKAEADALGKKSFNGLNLSCTSIKFSPAAEGTDVTVELAPARYLLTQAMSELAKRDNLSMDQCAAISPKMANVSLICVVKENDQYYLLAQIKGAALGSGQIHAGLVAGGVMPKHLDAIAAGKNPFIEALRSEALEELGIPLTQLRPSSFCAAIDESHQGMINFVASAQGADLADILNSYSHSALSKLETSKNPEVAGLSLLPVQGLTLIPLEGEFGISPVRSFIPSLESKAVVEVQEHSRKVRPYTGAFVLWLEDPLNRRALIEQAGF